MSPSVKLLAALTFSLTAIPDSQAGEFIYTTVLSGPAEAPPNASPGVGTGTVIYDDVARTMRIQTSFSGLLSPVTVAHIHAPTAVPGAGTVGVATRTPSFLGFPSGVTAGSYDQTFDLTLASTWNASFITANGGTPAGAEAAFFAAMGSGRAYLNIHTSLFPGGEIRGFFAPVPEPTTWALMIAGFGMTGAALRRSRRQPAIA